VSLPSVQRFGEKLRTLRKGRELTTRQLAREIGISGTHVSDLENNKAKPGADLVLRVAVFFQVTTDQLLHDHLELPPLT
jgi:transcriptional regulator with XRE-family HTH domain